MRNKGDKQKGDVTSISRFDSGAGKTIIGREISVEGTINGREDLVINGSVNGTIILEGFRLTIGPEGRVEGDINAENVTVSGKLDGNIKATDKVEITKEAVFNGDIRAKRLSVEDGAYLKAVIELDQKSHENTWTGDISADRDETVWDTSGTTVEEQNS